MFFWCHIRHLNPLKTHPEIITNAEEKMANYLDYDAIEFRICKKDYCKIERKKIIFSSMYFVMKIIRFILFMYQMKNLRIVWIY